jgi:putative aminopeptidase FrvX
MDIKFLEKLTNEFGPSGHEMEIQRIVRDYGKPFAHDILYDRTGSVIFQHGNAGPKLLLAGHIDEIGYVIRNIEKDGFVSISNLGGINPANLLGQEIIIRPFKGGEKIIGITTGSSPERGKVIPLDKLKVDIGCSSAKEVEALGIRVGDPAVPYAQFREMFRKRKIKKDEKNPDSIEEEIDVHLAAAKAFDDRIGVFMGLEILRRISENKIEHPNILYIASTTQEEVGCRGAKTTAQMIQPDIGISLDVTPSGDVPGWDGIHQKMGKGVAISAIDNSMIANPVFKKYVLELAEELNIKAQIGFLPFGGTDAGTIHLTGIGAPSLFFGVPTRYVHSHHALLDLADVESTINLAVELIKRLDEKTIQSFTAI